MGQHAWDCRSPTRARALRTHICGWEPSPTPAPPKPVDVGGMLSRCPLDGETHPRITEAGICASRAAAVISRESLGRRLTAKTCVVRPPRASRCTHFECRFGGLTLSISAGIHGSIYHYIIATMLSAGGALSHGVGVRRCVDRPRGVGRHHWSVGVGWAHRRSAVTTTQSHVAYGGLESIVNARRR